MLCRLPCRCSPIRTPLYTYTNWRQTAATSHISHWCGISREAEDVFRFQASMNMLSSLSSLIPDSSFEGFPVPFSFSLVIAKSRNSHHNVYPFINFTPLKTCKMFLFPHKDLFLFCSSWQPFVTRLTHFCLGEPQRVLQCLNEQINYCS